MVSALVPQETDDHETQTEQAVGAAARRTSEIKKKVAKAISNRPKLLIVAWVVVLAVFAAVVPVAYVSWWVGIPHLAAWPGDRWLLWIPAALGVLFLSFVPLWAFFLATDFFQKVADVSLEVDEASFRKVQTRVQETELEAIRRFENSDEAGLLPLLTYSRAQLDAYYHLGLNQTRRSFFHGIIAMWLGFALLLIGLVLHIVPLKDFGLLSPSQDFKILLMGGAAIIEFISALFLWMYKSTTAQLIYLYDRQMFSHTAILAFRMSSGIKDQKGDETRTLIVNKLLDWKPGIGDNPLPKGSGISGLIKRPAQEGRGSSEA